MKTFKDYIEQETFSELIRESIPEILAESADLKPTGVVLNSEADIEEWLKNLGD